MKFSEKSSLFYIIQQKLFSTLAIIVVVGLYLFHVGGFIWCLLLFNGYYFISTCYLMWLYYDKDTCNNANRRWTWLRNSIFWKYGRSYFPIKMIKTSELSPTKNYIIGYHPHGIVPFGYVACFASDSLYFSKRFPGLTPYNLMARAMFWSPLTREVNLGLGSGVASKESIEYLLTEKGTGNALLLAIGGTAEALETHPGTANLVLKNRKGFVKLALKYGASLVPVFGFGENEILKQVKNPEGSLLRKIQNKLKDKIGFSIPLFYGKGIFQNYFGWMPFKKPITVVVGEPIHLEKEPCASEDRINAVHEQYIEKLKELFENHKEKYGPNLNLKII